MPDKASMGFAEGVLRDLVALREKFKRQCEVSEEIGSTMHDRVSVELSIMEIMLCFGVLDRALEGR